MASESFLQKNLFSIIPLILSIATAVGSSWVMQARLEERVTRQEQDIVEMKSDLKDKVAKAELEDLKKTLDEMRADIKELLKSRNQ